MPTRRSRDDRVFSDYDALMRASTAERAWIVADGTQVSHAGRVYPPGERVVAPDHIAVSWYVRGWATLADGEMSDRKAAR
jgi:hypothetical protein